MRLHRHVPFCFSAVCRLVSIPATPPKASIILTAIESFGRTNQTWVLGQDDTLPSVVNNLHDVCAFASTIFGHVASANSELPSSTSTPLPTSTSNSGSRPEYSVQATFMTIVILVSVLGL